MCVIRRKLCQGWVLRKKPRNCRHVIATRDKGKKKRREGKKRCGHTRAKRTWALCGVVWLAC